MKEWEQTARQLTFGKKRQANIAVIPTLQSRIKIDVCNLQRGTGEPSILNAQMVMTTEQGLLGILNCKIFKPLIFFQAPTLPCCPVIVCSRTAHLLTKIVSVVSLPSVRRNSWYLNSDVLSFPGGKHQKLVCRWLSFLKITHSRGSFFYGLEKMN